MTSAALGASVGQSIVYGYVPADRAAVGTALSVMVAGERFGATVTAEPLFDPKMERLKDLAAVSA